MDPRSAVGIASASAQFISFASQMISTTTDLYNSCEDTPKDINNLNIVYSQLQTICHGLIHAAERLNSDQATSNLPTSKDSDAGNDTPTNKPLGDSRVLQGAREMEMAIGNVRPELQDIYSNLQGILSQCQKDSHYMLSVVSKLKPEENAGSVVKNFRAAFTVVWKQDEIKSVKERLQRCQTALMATMCRISNVYHIQHSRDLAAMRQDSQSLDTEHSEQLSAIQSALHGVETNIKFETNIESLGVDINSLEQTMRRVSLLECKVRMELDIISSLGFKMRHLRHDAIPIAHQETFQWVFEPSTSQATSSDQKDQTTGPKLLNWLEHGNKTFWVSGKPGSGKSTFMKFIANHRETAEALSRWSHPHRVIISSCYFWNSGADMQKSLKGLLQTLIYDILRSCPQLIQHSCPARWSGDISSPGEWTENELRSTLERVLGQVEAPYKFCFFIDGLDEYDGDHIDFCRYLSTIFGNNIKICVSSRPWNVFNDAFGQDPATRLFIHELTWNDIMSYTRDRLHQHPRWLSLESQTNEAGSLIREVVTRSEGVFLWAYLVTRLLREGLTNGDSLLDLKRQLFSFPTELEEFFKKMLEPVSSLEHEKMAGDLLLTIYAPEPLETLVYSFVDGEYEDENYLERMPVMEESPEAVYMRQEQTVRRLKARCCGLLEEQLGTIHFLHRTIADFLKTGEMSDFLGSRAPRSFKTGVSILKAYAAWVKISSFHHGHFQLYEHEKISENDIQQSSLYRGIRTALKYASYLESDLDISKAIIDGLVDDIDSTLGDLAVKIDPLRSVDFPDAYEYVSRLCRILALDTPLMGYLSRKLSEQPSFLSILDRSPILLVLWPPMASDSTWPVASRQKLDIVLRAGSDPNDPTVWRRFMSEILLDNSTPSKQKFQDGLEQGLIQLFLDNRADPCVRLPDDKSAFNWFVVRAVFSMDWNENAMDMYLQALSSFIYGGAVLEPNIPPSTTGSQETDYQYQLRILSSGFYKRMSLGGLEEKLDWINKLNLKPQRRFIARLIEKIIPCARQAGWPLMYFLELMDRVTSVSELSSPSTISELSVGHLKRDNESDGLEVNEQEPKRRSCERSEQSSQNC